MLQTITTMLHGEQKSPESDQKSTPAIYHSEFKGFQSCFSCLIHYITYSFINLLLCNFKVINYFIHIQQKHKLQLLATLCAQFMPQIFKQHFCLLIMPMSSVVSCTDIWQPFNGRQASYSLIFQLFISHTVRSPLFNCMTTIISVFRPSQPCSRC